MAKQEHGDSFQVMNERLISTFSDSSKLNFCRFLLPEKEGQVSIVAKYMPCACVEQDSRGKAVTSTEPFLTLKKSGTSADGLEEVENKDYNSYYYGISPTVSETVIVEAIAEGRLKDNNGLNRFIADHCTEFMLHKN